MLDLKDYNNLVAKYDCVGCSNMKLVPIRRSFFMAISLKYQLFKLDMPTKKFPNRDFRLRLVKEMLCFDYQITTLKFLRYKQQQSSVAK